MTLNEYAAKQKLEIFERLKAGLEPAVGKFDRALFLEAKSKGAPQVGTTRFEPHAIHFEFIYPQQTGAALLFKVEITPPERIVFLPVPSWVIESIWQGDIDGSYFFESQANQAVEQFKELLSPEKNGAQFGNRQPTGRV